MAGRPKARARRITEIEEVLYRALDDYTAAMPDRVMSETGIDALWDAAFHRLLDAQRTVEVLLRELEAKAGMDSEALQKKRDERDFEGCTETETTEEAVETQAS